MSPEQLDRELEIYRARALHFADLFLLILHFPELTGKERHYMVDLICLAEEAPEDHRPEIEYLIDRLYALQMLN